MTREDKYLLGCRFAISRMIEKDSVYFSVKDDTGKFEYIPWIEVIEWIDKQYGIAESEE